MMHIPKENTKIPTKLLINISSVHERHMWLLHNNVHLILGKHIGESLWGMK